MKQLYLLIVFIIIALVGYGQNLVPNAGFEVHDTCPNNEDQVEHAAGWNKCSTNNWGASGSGIHTTPDYYNSCCPSNSFGIPQSGNLFQPDLRSCGAYIGLITYALPNLADWREQVGIHLSQPLVVGQKYYLSFTTVLGGLQIGTDNYDHPSNNIGMRLSTVEYNPANPAPIDNFSHIHSASIITDTANWIRITGSIIADSAYTYVMLGNFYDDSNTDTLLYNCATCYNDYSYYLVDNICISIDSVYCDGGIDASPCTVSIRELSDENNISVFPNPTLDAVSISFNGTQSEIIQLTDLLGEVVYSETFKGKSNISFSLTAYPSGIYFLKFINNNNNEQKVINKKIIKL